RKMEPAGGGEHLSSLPFTGAKRPHTSKLIQLSEKDFDHLQSTLNTSKARIKNALQNEYSLSNLKVSELKMLITYLRNTHNGFMKISGNKSELIQRIASEVQLLGTQPSSQPSQQKRLRVLPSQMPLPPGVSVP